ncbi:hypothetical protein MKX01_000917 [Papaver californicum]|nr:hypothetical protein MKX01_000917 [Papaver californicum]
MVSLLRKPFSSSLQTLTLQRLTRTLTYVSGERGRFEEVSSETKSSFIHPTAIIHPNAVIDQDVTIGPFCTVGSMARIGKACKLYPGSHIFGDTELGERCTLMTGAIVGEDIPGRTTIGCNNIIGHHAVVGVKCQDMKYKPGSGCFLDVGDNNEIREYTSVHRSSKSSDRTVIGDNDLIMGSCHIAHDCKLGNNIILANNTLIAGHVVVGDYAHSAGAVVVHQFCHLGSHSFIGGGSVVSQDVPMYMMVTGDRADLRGLNFEGLRRHGFSSEEVKGMRRAYQKIFMPVDGKLGGIEDRLAEVEQTKELAISGVGVALGALVKVYFQESAKRVGKYSVLNKLTTMNDMEVGLQLSKLFHYPLLKFSTRV